ncbi:MAG: SsrA-binding protein [Patescibacteria group bacterium]|nr:SsrA-binding protein [Patescibacteria group bacterium]
MRIVNKTWQRNFSLIEDIEAGIVLTGAEAKSIMQGRMKLEGAYVKLTDDGPVLVNAEVYRYQYNGDREYNPLRRRKLLLNKKEILRLKSKMASTPGLTIVPITCYPKGRKIKLSIALVKGRIDTEKRRLEKAKEIKRKQQKEIKELYR